MRGSGWSARAIAGPAFAALVVACSDGEIAAVDAGAGADAGPLPACTNVPSAPSDRPPSTPTVLAAATTVTALAVDEQEVFFAGLVDGKPALHAIPKKGGALRKVSATAPSHLESDGPWLYGDGIRIDKSNGTVMVYDTSAAHVGHDEGAVYLVVEQNALIRINKGGSGERIELARNVPRQATLRDGYVYWRGTRGSVQERTPTLFRVPTRGGPVETVSVGGFGEGVAIDCHHVYFSLFDSDAFGSTVPNAVGRMRLGGGPVAPVVGIADRSDQLFVDAASLYAVSNRAIWRVSLATGAPTQVKGLYEGRQFAIGDDAVYWSGPDGVMRAEK